MNIQITYKYSKQRHETTLEEFIQGEITRTVSDTRGVAETADEKAERVGAAVGALCVLLCEKKLLTLEEVISAITPFYYDKEVAQLQ